MIRMSDKPTRMKVILDPEGGICGGVERVIEIVEKELAVLNKDIYVVGDIIHNEREVERLNQAGLKTIHIDDLDNMDLPSTKNNTRILIRAHGEPPETYLKLDRLHVEVIDGTCPVVTKSQNLADRYCKDGYQVAIVGKHHHPEMIGILGHTNHRAVVVQYDEDVRKLEPGKPTLVMAQTTISPEHFHEMYGKIEAWVGEVVIRETICKAVVKRSENLKEFAKQMDVLLMVGGHKSSNTKMLHNICLSVNPNSYHVVSPEELDPAWFNGAQVIGVSGSASTPLWLLQEFVDFLEQWIEEGKIG